MSLAVYKKLGLRARTLMTMQFLMADRTMKKVVGISYDMLIKVENSIFPVNFVILDWEVNFKLPVILGRPFLGTS